MKTQSVSELKEQHLKEIAALERKEAIASILPSEPTSIHLHKNYVSVVYSKEYPSRYSFRDALSILDQYSPVSAEHWKNGCLSVQPLSINSYAKEDRAKKEAESVIEIKLCAGKGYDSHCLSFWTEVQGNLIRVSIDLQPEWRWLPQTQFRYNSNGDCISSHVSPASLGEDFKRSWWSPPGSYQLSYYWRTLDSFNQEFRPL